MMQIINLELGVNCEKVSRKVLVEVINDSEVHWLVAEYPLIDDTKITIEFGLFGVLRFTDLAQAMLAFEKYLV